jgi:hypothetical protein
MSIKSFLMGHPLQTMGNIAAWTRYYVGDTDAEKPTTGLIVGSLYFAVDNGKLYKATSATNWTEIGAAGGGASWGAISGTLADQTDLNTALAAKVPTTRTVAGKALSSDVTLVKGDVGLGSVDNTADTAKPVSTAQQTALNLKADLASPALTGTPTAPTAGAGTNTTQLATTAYAVAAAPNASYRVILDSSGSHIAARVAGTYGFAQSQPIAISGTGTLYPLNAIYIAAADFPTVNGLTAKLRVRAQLFVNDVAPTGNFTFGLHPITRPATSGGAGLVIYTIGAAVSGSTAAVNTPAADSSNVVASSDFSLPTDGHYVLGVVTTATVATSSHLHMSVALQLRNA